MDPVAITAIIGAIGLWIDRIINGRRDAIRNKKIFKALRECRARDAEREERLKVLEAKQEVGEAVKDFIKQGRDSDYRKIKVELDGIRALFDPEKRRITQIAKSSPGETIEGS